MPENNWQSTRQPVCNSKCKCCNASTWTTLISDWASLDWSRLSLSRYRRGTSDWLSSRGRGKAAKTWSQACICRVLSLWSMRWRRSLCRNVQFWSSGLSLARFRCNLVLGPRAVLCSNRHHQLWPYRRDNCYCNCNTLGQTHYSSARMPETHFTPRMDARYCTPWCQPYQWSHYSLASLSAYTIAASGSTDLSF